MSRRPRDQRRRAPERTFIQRFGYQIISALVIVGVVAIGAYIYLQSSRPAFACESLLTPPPATPTPSITTAPIISPSPTPTASPTPAASPTATPAPSGSPGAGPSASPGASASPTPIGSPTPVPTPTPAPTPWVGFTVSDAGNLHVSTSQTINYAECPPASGPHYADPARRGYYGPDQHLPAGAWVHSLEHGMVVVLYSCGESGNACPDPSTLDALRNLADTAPQAAAAFAAGCIIQNKIIVARFDQMSTKFAALGWDRAMLSDTFDPNAFLTFYNQWVDKSPTVEATGCDGTISGD